MNIKNFISAITVCLMLSACSEVSETVYQPESYITDYSFSQDGNEYSASDKSIAVPVEENSEEPTTSAVDKSDFTEIPDLTLSNLPYHGLSFSGADFKIAGYSPYDGDHLDEVYKIMRKDVPLVNAYAKDCWQCWNELTWPGTAELVYFPDYGTSAAGRIAYTTSKELVELIPESKRNFKAEVSYKYIGYIKNEDYPLVDFPVLPMDKYDDVIERLDISDIVNESKKNIYYQESGPMVIASPKGYKFMSQFGETTCLFYDFTDTNETEILIYSDTEKLELKFGDDVLESVVYTHTETKEAAEIDNTPTDPSDYKAIYKKFLLDMLNSGELLAGGSEPAGFDLYNLDADGIPELFISQGGYHTAAVNIYTIYNGEVILLSDNIGSWGVIPVVGNKYLLGGYSGENSYYVKDGNEIRYLLTHIYEYPDRNSDERIDMGYWYLDENRNKTPATFDLGFDEDADIEIALGDGHKFDRKSITDYFD